MITYSLPDTVVGAGDRAVNKTKIPAFVELVVRYAVK